MSTSKDHKVKSKSHKPLALDPLQSSHLYYFTLYEESPVGFVILERSGRIQYCNQLVGSLLGMESTDLIGRFLSDFVDPTEKGHLFLHIFEVCQSGESSQCEVHLMQKEKIAHCIELRSKAAPDRNNPYKKLCHTALLDIDTSHSQVKGLWAQLQESNRKVEQSSCDLVRSSTILLKETQELEKTEARLLRTNALFEKVFDTSYLAIAVLDMKLNFIRVNLAFSENTQQPPEYFQGRNYFSLFPDDDARRLFSQILETGQPLIEFARPFVQHKGTKKHSTWWDWTVSTVTDPQGQVEGLLLCMTNVTKRVELERELMQITDREQKRLGRELHDGMAQLLTAISIKAKILEHAVKDKAPESMATIIDISDLLREATIQTRDLSRLLNPTVVEAQGLIPALEALCQETKRRMEVMCEFHWEDSIPSFSPAIAGHLYRITQEAITNAIRHGQAKHIRIKLFTQKNKRVLEISNDGTPFSLTSLKSTDGLGLKGIQYRAELIGAIFSIEPDAQGYTVVRCELTRPILLSSPE